VVKGDVTPLHKFSQVVLVPVPTSTQVALPELEESTLYQVVSSNGMLVDRNPIIAKMIEDVSPERLRKTVEHLSTFYTRLSTSAPGTVLLHCNIYVMWGRRLISCNTNKRQFGTPRSGSWNSTLAWV
jgi:hypothetical protein